MSDKSNPVKYWPIIRKVNGKPVVVAISFSDGTFKNITGPWVAIAGK
jgi:hypothetical protein